MPDRKREDAAPAPLLQLLQLQGQQQLERRKLGSHTALMPLLSGLLPLFCVLASPLLPGGARTSSFLNSYRFISYHFVTLRFELASSSASVRYREPIAILACLLACQSLVICPRDLAKPVLSSDKPVLWLLPQDPCRSSLLCQPSSSFCIKALVSLPPTSALPMRPSLSNRSLFSAHTRSNPLRPCIRHLISARLPRDLPLRLAFSFRPTLVILPPLLASLLLPNRSTLTRI